MATKNINILQWNCRGLRSNFDELQLLIHQYNPVALCLQETMLGDKDLAVKHFSCYYCPGSEVNGNHSGGVGILVSNITPHSQLQLRTSLQAIAIRVSVPKALTICSIYLPPHTKWTEQDLKDLISQLPKPFLLLGDFNAHSPIWGSKKLDCKGKTDIAYVC